MPIPFLVIAEVVATGSGTLVAHSSGGMIFTGASGYMTGTFISTAALAQFTWSVMALLGSALAWFSGLPALIIGGPGIMGTTIGASGVTGFLMKVGLISSTPIWVPVVALLFPLLLLIGLWRWWSLRRRLSQVRPGEELMFTSAEVRFVRRLLLWALLWRRVSGWIRGRFGFRASA